MSKVLRKQVEQRLLNLFLRMGGMGSRFLLTLVLARLLEPAEIGQLGLFFALISFSALLVGGDYYTHSLRELLSSTKERWPFIIQHQVLANGVLYFFLLPLGGLFFVFNVLPKGLIGWFFALLLVDHMVSEVNRLLVAMQRPLLASWVLFIRMGAWVWVVVPVMWFFPETRHYGAVFGGWLAGDIVAIVLGLRVILREVAPWQLSTWDWGWLLQGFRTGLTLLLATLCFKALTTLDRFVVGAITDPNLLGVYVLYTSISMANLSILDAAVFSFLYPRLVRAQREGKTSDYRCVRREMLWSTLGVGIFLSALIVLIAPSLFEWIGHPVYAEHEPLLWLLLLVTFVYSLGMIPHYSLYARGADHSILAAHLSALILFALVTAVCAAYFPLEAAAIGLLAAFGWVGLFKQAAYNKLVRQKHSI